MLPHVEEKIAQPSRAAELLACCNPLDESPPLFEAGNAWHSFRSFQRGFCVVGCHYAFSMPAGQSITEAGTKEEAI
jgi:hypothetical protein